MAGVRPLLLTAALFLFPLFVRTVTGVFREQVIPGPPGGATEVVRGPDGGFWFTEFDANQIGTFSRDGRFREFVVPTPNSGPRGIAVGRDAVWFTEFKVGKIGKLTTDGVFTEYAIPSLNSAPWGITPAQGGMWFTESGTSKIGLIREDGTITERPVPTANSEPRGIVSYAYLCFAEFRANQIGCLDFLGVIRERAIPTPNAGPETVGLDNLGNIWFTETLANRIGVIRFFNVPTLLDAPVEEFVVPTPASGLMGLTTDFQGGGAWFTERSGGQVGFIAQDGRITEYPLSDRSSRPTGIFLDIEIRFIESAANRLVEIEPDAVLVAGAGSSGAWQTEFRFANIESRPVTVFAGVYPRPGYICGVCTVPQLLRKIPANGSSTAGIDVLRLNGLGVVFIRALEDGVLPSVRARVFNASVPSQSLDLPTIRLSRLTELNPALLSFPGAMRLGAVHSNLWIAEVGTRESMNVAIELIDPEGQVIASRAETLIAGGSIYVVDLISTLGVASFPDGQVRVRKSGDQGLLWGYLATVNSDGAVSVFSGLNP